jgi:ribosomal protein S18 acetylase RimI-like enzyme
MIVLVTTLQATITIYLFATAYTLKLPRIPGHHRRQQTVVAKMIRPAEANDLHAMKNIIDANELFPSEMLNEMTKSYFEGKSDEVWFVKVKDNLPIAVVFAGPEKMTEGCFNAFLLAVAPNCQREGHGRDLMIYLADHLQSSSVARILLVETSGNDEYAGTRHFYTAIGYKQVAMIPEFYQKGEDKIIYLKTLC